MNSIPLLLTVLVYGNLVGQPVSAGWTKNWPVEAEGRVTCNGQPMSYVSIWLMDDDPFFDQKMGSTRSNSHGRYGGSATNYSYEGNVAAALRKLRQKCKSSDRKMVDVLKRSGNEKIHGFSKYNSQHGLFYGCHL